MLPTLPADCEIELAPLSPSVKLGELIVFVAGDTLIAHRLVRRTGGYWIAQGDHRRVPDRPIRPDQVVGCVRAAYQNNRRCWPRRFSSVWRLIWLARHHGLRVLRVGWRIGQKVVPRG